MSLLDTEVSTEPLDSAVGRDRRMHRRVALRVPASVCLGSGPWHDAGLTRNLSAGGALIELPAAVADEYAAGDPIELEVRIPAGEGVWPEPTVGRAEAVVLRSYSPGADDASRGGAKLVALRFVDRLRFRLD